MSTIHLAASAQNKSPVIKRKKRGLAALWQQQTFRRVVQLIFAGFIIAVTAQHTLAGESSTSASGEAFCPFGGIETLYKYVTSGGSYVPHTHLSNLVLGGAVLLVALLAHSAFCGWICPLGFAQDLVAGFSAFVQRKVKPVRKAVKFLKTRAAFLSHLDRPLRFLKYGVLIWAVGGAAAFGVMVFRDIDPWIALLQVAEWSWGPAAIVLIITLVASLFVERPWCRYACPLGAASGLIGKLSPMRIERNESVCKPCSMCSKACPMGLKVDKMSKVESVDCIGCLACLQACPREGALELKVGVPLLPAMRPALKQTPASAGEIS